MIRNDVIEKINEYDQKHLLAFYDELSDEQKASYDEQLNNLDFGFIDLMKNGGDHKEADSVYEPIKAMKLDEIETRKDEFSKAGIEAIKNCKVGAVLLAGGQGTRLGFDKPKGMFNIGVNKEMYIFERLVCNLLDVVKLAGAYVPLFIMTSEKNDKDTREFFEEKNYFGYDKEFVHFFVQDMAPSVSEDGKFLMDAKDRLCLTPNGNGGWFSSLVSAGLVDKMKELGVEWLNVFAVDNVLQRIADPLFVGATLLSGAPCGAKVVRKAEPGERVGVMCKENGKPSIVEYYELTEEMMDAKDENGEPAYNYGVILNYIFEVEKLCAITDNKLTNHMANKKIPHINEKGEMVNPEEPNGYKFETLILDMINMLDDCLVFEVERKKEFAPVKNKTGVDSIDTARELLQFNGIEI